MPKKSTAKSSKKETSKSSNKETAKASKKAATTSTTEFDDLVDNTEEVIDKKRKHDSIALSDSGSESDQEDIDTDSSISSVEVKKSSKSKKQKKQKKAKTDSKKPVVVDSESDVEQPTTSTAKKSSKSSKNEDGAKSKASKSNANFVKPTKRIEGEDPSSDHKTDTHTCPVNYNGKTYWCKRLPANFQQHLDGIIEMRSGRDADVDRIGAGLQFDQNEEDPAVRRFQILVALILSSQTTDKQTDLAMQRLLDHGLTIESMINISFDKLNSMIANLSFHDNKTNHLKNTAKICRDKHGGDVPHTLKDFKALPGCGFKVASLAMYYCRDTVTGVGVDTHCSRILQRLGWAGPDLTTNKKASADSQAREIVKWLPAVLWGDINELLVGFGQTICEARAPKCDTCRIRSVCPYAALNF